MKKIFYNSEEAAQLKTVTGWVSSNGHFYGDNEHLARWDGSTHNICACGNERTKSYTICDICRNKEDNARYLAKSYKVWDEETPLCLYDDDDRYFFSKDDIQEYFEELVSEGEEIDIANLRLVICEPQYPGLIPEDYYCDELPEEHYLEEVNPELAEKIEELNEFIRGCKPLSWVPGKYRTSLSEEFIKEINDVLQEITKEEI